mgnify:CR=1 FL=1
MGIDANLVHHLGVTARVSELGGVLCTLGEPTMHCDELATDRALEAAGLHGPPDVTLYRRLGFNGVESVDVSASGGSRHILDLNAPGVPEHLRGRFDAVYNGGTLEHIFDIRSALRNIFELLAPGGVVIHSGPANGWLEHGFYQFSPTLLVDYYIANRFEVLQALVHERVHDEGDAVLVHTYLPDIDLGQRVRGRCGFYMPFRKRPESTWDVLPQQRYYASLHGMDDAVTSAWPVRYAPPYRLEGGVRSGAPATFTVIPSPVHAEGHQWVVPVPDMTGASDSLGNNTSRLMLFEDRIPIGPPHSQHGAIRRLGQGRYSHWHDSLLFSPTRNDDARTHVYEYAASPHDL